MVKCILSNSSIRYTYNVVNIIHLLFKIVYKNYTMYNAVLQIMYTVHYKLYNVHN